jgi:hypothetical protein
MLVILSWRLLIFSNQPDKKWQGRENPADGETRQLACLLALLGARVKSIDIFIYANLHDLAVRPCDTCDFCDT